MAKVELASQSQRFPTGSAQGHGLRSAGKSGIPKETCEDTGSTPACFPAHSCQLSLLVCSLIQGGWMSGQRGPSHIAWIPGAVFLVSSRGRPGYGLT